MSAARLWNDLDQVLFVKVESDGKTTQATVEPESWKNFILAFTIKKSALDQGDYFDNFRRKLGKAHITLDTFFRHAEAEWSNHEGGSGISIHILGFKPPSNAKAEAHFDAYGGNWWNLGHVVDVALGRGTAPDDVTRWLARNPSSREYLRGFGTEVDKLVTEGAKK
jgi:hypothetical protein